MMARFRSELDVRDLHREGNGIRLMLLAPLIYDSAILRQTVYVPARFVTDLASIPRVFWVVLPPLGKYDAAAVLHDWLYQANGVTRGEADGVLREAMEVDGVDAPLRAIIWSGCRVGGWLPWRKFRQMERVEVAAKIARYGGSDAA